MKKILFVLSVLFTSISFAQLKTGAIQYSISVDAESEEQEQVAAMFEGSKMTVYFKPNMTALDMEMGMFMKIATVSDAKKGKTLTLMDIMGQKIAVRDAEADTPKKTETIEKTSETKTILGYNCTKYRVIDESDNMVTMWVTEEILINTEGQTIFRKDIKGTPLAFSTIQNGMKMNFEVTKIETKANKNKFSMKIPAGYEEKTAEELKAQAAGGQ